LLIVPTPHGLSAAAWHYFALFATVVAALVVEPIPAAACAKSGLGRRIALGLVALMGRSTIDRRRSTRTAGISRTARSGATEPCWERSSWQRSY
jgi:di/tricarboxylate transporter